jgi:histidyl-tRNA synthetase
VATISTKPPSGMRDFLAPDVARRRHVVGVIQEVYESFGFVPLETPAIENLSTLLGKYGPEGDQLLFRVLHRREKLQRALEKGAPTEADLADEGLRYDLTVPLARVVANYRELPAFYKRYQIQPVWRADRPARGRFREFFQCDVDVTGTRSPLADAEVCGAVATVLQRLGFAEFSILVNHRELLRALVAEAGIAPELEATALVALDKLDKVGADGVRAELAQRGVSAERATRMLESIDAARRPDYVERRAHRSQGAQPEDPAAALHLLLEILKAGPAGPHVRFEPALARGLSYYTGAIFEVTVADLAGSLGGGGRYDNLIGMFLGRDVPAVGFSLGLERILLVMEERGMFRDIRAGPEVVLCRMADVDSGAILRCATALRGQGIRVEVFADHAQLGKQLQYAAKIGARFAAIMGSSELVRGEIAIKDLASGEQRSVPLAAARSVVR